MEAKASLRGFQTGEGRCLNVVLHTNMFKVWWKNKDLVELGRFYPAWRRMNFSPASERRKFPNAALGAWLKFDYKKTSISIKLLNSALEDFRALNAQVVYEGGGDPISID